MAGPAGPQTTALYNNNYYYRRGLSSGSAPSRSAVQVSGTRFPHTSETFILLRLFAKLLRLICFCNYYRHCNAVRCRSTFIDVDRAL